MNTSFKKMITGVTLVLMADQAFAQNAVQIMNSALHKMNNIKSSALPGKKSSLSPRKNPSADPNLATHLGDDGAIGDYTPTKTTFAGGKSGKTSGQSFESSSNGAGTGGR